MKTQSQKLTPPISPGMFMRIFLATLLLSAFLQMVPAPSYATNNYHRIAVNFSFDASSVPGKQLKGYRLFAAGKPVCEQAATALATPITCTVNLVDGTYPFTLSVTFQDGAETAQSSPFSFTLSKATALPGVNPAIHLLLLSGT